jgi:uncharacterized membrane protein
MPSPHPHAPSTTAIAAHLIHAVLGSFPLVCFTLALGTDVAYWRTSNLMWSEFSAWLLLAGIVLGGLAAVIGTARFLIDADRREEGPAWPQVIGTVLVLVLAFFNNLVHAHDGWTAVVPWGLILSALTVLALFITAWFNASRIHFDGVGVRTYA